VFSRRRNVFEAPVASSCVVSSHVRVIWNWRCGALRRAAARCGAARREWICGSELRTTPTLLITDQSHHAPRQRCVHIDHLVSLHLISTVPTSSHVRRGCDQCKQSKRKLAFHRTGFRARILATNWSRGIPAYGSLQQ